MKLLLRALKWLHLQEAAVSKSLPPWISVPESDAKGRNSTAVSNAQLTPTMGFCQGKGRGKGETTTISICPGPECLLNQCKILYAQGHANRSGQAQPRSSCSPWGRMAPGTGREVPGSTASPKPAVSPSLPCQMCVPISTAPGKASLT